MRYTLLGFSANWPSARRACVPEGMLEYDRVTCSDVGVKIMIIPWPAHNPNLTNLTSDMIMQFFRKGNNSAKELLPPGFNFVYCFSVTG